MSEIERQFRALGLTAEAERLKTIGVEALQTADSEEKAVDRWIGRMLEDEGAHDAAMRRGLI